MSIDESVPAFAGGAFFIQKITASRGGLQAARRNTGTGRIKRTAENRRKSC
nr:MAG TPA: hypothetical protein [Caudoviricetes sp.]